MPSRLRVGKKPAPNPAEKLRSTLAPDELLKCPHCGAVAQQLNKGIVERKRGKGVTIWGKEFGFFSHRQSEAIWCNHCGYTYYRLLS